MSGSQSRQLAQILALLSQYNKVDLSKLKVATEYVNLGGISDAAMLMQALTEQRKQIVGGTLVNKYSISELGGEIRIVGISGRVVSVERVMLPHVITYKCALCGTKFNKSYSVLHAIGDHLKKHDWTVSVCPACRYEAKMSMEDRHELYSMIKMAVTDGTGTITVYAPTSLYDGKSSDVNITGVYMPHPLGHFIYAAGIDADAGVSISQDQVMQALYKFITADTLTVAAILASVVRPSKSEPLRTLIFITWRGYGTWRYLYKAMTAVSVKTKVVGLPRLKLHPSTPVVAFANGTNNELDILNDIFNGTLYYGGAYVHMNNNLVVYTTNPRAFKMLRGLGWDLVAVVSKSYAVSEQYLDVITAGLRNAVLKLWDKDVEGCDAKICKSAYKLTGKRIMASVVQI
jgi:DNA-directed RNA polymerase subunit RPC12/RpoP